MKIEEISDRKKVIQNNVFILNFCAGELTRYGEFVLSYRLFQRVTMKMLKSFLPKWTKKRVDVHPPPPLLNPYCIFPLKGGVGLKVFSSSPSHSCGKKGWHLRERPSLLSYATKYFLRLELFTESLIYNNNQRRNFMKKITQNRLFIQLQYGVFNYFSQRVSACRVVLLRLVQYSNLCCYNYLAVQNNLFVTQFELPRIFF